MSLDYHHLTKSALAGVLFLCVFQFANLAIAGLFFVALIFFIGGLYAAMILINEHRIPNQDHSTQFFILLLICWLAILAKLFISDQLSSDLAVWFAVLFFCSLVLLSKDRAMRIVLCVMLAFWLNIFLFKSPTLVTIESGLALTILIILMSIINHQVNNLQAKLNIVEKSDHLTGCLLPEQFKYELDKAQQLYNRYATPFSLISIEYKTQFESEADLDIWLKEFSGLYQSRLRKTDILCRFSSHKFMILLPSTNKDNACRLSDDLEKCSQAYEFSYLKHPETQALTPTLTFKVLNYSGDETSQKWLRLLQGNTSNAALN